MDGGDVGPSQEQGEQGPTWPEHPGERRELLPELLSAGPAPPARGGLPVPGASHGATILCTRVPGVCPRVAHARRPAPSPPPPFSA